METITLTEAKAKLSHFADKAEAGEEIIVTRMGKPVMRMGPCKNISHSHRIGFMKGKGEVVGNFNEWPEDIARILGIID